MSMRHALTLLTALLLGPLAALHAAFPNMDGRMGLDVTKDMIATEKDALILRARSEPWGSKTRTFLYKEIGAVASQWTIETKLVFESELLQQHAGLFFGTDEKHVRFTVGRPGDPYTLNLTGPDRQTLPAIPQGYRAGRPLWLRLMRIEDRVWAFFSLDGKTFAAAGYTGAKPLDGLTRAGVCFVDDNPHKNETRIPAGAVKNGCATFAAFSFSNDTDAALVANIPRVFVKVTLHAVEPADKPVKLAATLYSAVHTRLYKFGLARGGVTPQFPLGWHTTIPWKEIPSDAALKPGESSDWSEWTSFFAAPRLQTTMALALWQDGRPAPEDALRDNGNVAAYDLEISFATAPRDDAIVKRIRYKSDFHTLALYFPPNQGTLDKWAGGIRTLHQYAADRRAVYEKGGATPLNPDRPFDIAVDCHTGYHARLYDAPTQQIENKIKAMLGENIPLIGLALPAVEPWDPQSVEKFKTAFARAKAPTGRFVAKLGDEPHVVSLDRLRKSEPGLRAFRDWLRARGEEKWENAMPVDSAGVTTDATARLRYLTAWFLQESTAKMFRAMRDACHELWGERVTATADAYFAGFNTTPDYFVESRFGATDRFGHHFAGERSYTYDLFNANMYRCAARFGRTKPGFLFFVCRIGQEDGTLLSGHAALSRGLNYIHYYGFGPMYSGWEWFSDDRYKVPAFLAAAQISRTAARYAPYFDRGVQPQPRVATLLSRSANVWAGANEFVESLDLLGHEGARAEREKAAKDKRPPTAAAGWGCERNMLHCALNWANVPVDVLPVEEAVTGRLADYRVLYVYEPNLDADAQQRIADWVRAGGVLYLGPAAATRDEINKPRNLLEALTGQRDTVKLAAFEPGGKFPQRGLAGEIWSVTSTYNEKNAGLLGVLDTVKLGDGREFPALGRKEIIRLDGARTVATYRDGSAAIVALRVGKGCVVKAGTCLGAAYARSGKPALDATTQLGLPPVPHWRDEVRFYQRQFDAAVQDAILEPVIQAALQTPVRCSVRGVDANVFEMPDASGAIVMFGNYTTEPTAGLTARVRLSHRYRQARAFSGKPVALEPSADLSVLKFDLGLTEVVELLP